MNISKNQTGSALIIILTVIGSLAILGVLGFLLWTNFLKPTSAPATETVVTTALCLEGEDEHATNGVFCSETIGIKFTVPTVFKAIIEEADNYPVTQGTTDPGAQISAGDSEAVFEGVISGDDNVRLTIAKEPLRTGYVGVAHALSNTYYDQSTGLLSNVNFEDNSIGETVPSIEVAGITLYKATLGDAGVVILTYFGVLNDKFVKIELHYTGFLGPEEEDPSTIDSQTLFDEFNAGVEGLVTL